MPLIECKLGEAETVVAGNTYVFQRDDHGRYVCHVERQEDVACLISVDPYRIVEALPVEEKPKKTRRTTKAKDPATTETKASEDANTAENPPADDETASDAPEVSAEDMRNIAASVLAGDITAPEGIAPEEYAKQLTDAADVMDADAAAAAEYQADQQTQDPPRAAEKPKTTRRRRTTKTPKPC